VPAISAQELVGVIDAALDGSVEEMEQNKVFAARARATYRALPDEVRPQSCAGPSAGEAAAYRALPDEVRPQPCAGPSAGEAAAYRIAGGNA
jgi:2-oxoglutarate ferredoxin oxidoreductase subunit alpha